VKSAARSTLTSDALKMLEDKQSWAKVMFEECAFIAVTTADLEQAKRFWVTLLGCAVVREDKNYLMVDAGGVRLCFDLPNGDDHQQPGSDPVIGLKVKDLDAALEALSNSGIRAIAGPFDDRHGKWAKLLDPDGRTVILTERG
jgi:catechol 2,3-dioxygenase-like lactoylglutathione lyase family enzyme